MRLLVGRWVSVAGLPPEKTEESSRRDGSSYQPKMSRRKATFYLVLLFVQLTRGEEGGVPLGEPEDPDGPFVDAGGYVKPFMSLVGPDGTPFQEEVLTLSRDPLSDPLLTNAIEESLLAAAKTVLAHNLIPRFKIPRGNLTYLTNPHWEVLYFLKHGHFPAATERKLKNTTVDLSERLRNIRSILDQKSDRLGWWERAAEELGREDGLHYSTSLEGVDLSRFDPDAFFRWDGPLSAFMPTREEAKEMVREYERRHGVIHEGASGPPASDNQESNFLDGLTLALKAPPKTPPLKRDGILKYFLDRAHKQQQQQQTPVGGGDGRSTWMKTFLVDHDPSWVRTRLTKTTKPHVVHRSDAEPRSLYSSGEGAISARSGGGGGASGGTGGGGGADDSSSNQGGQRRKFQTQGW